MACLTSSFLSCQLDSTPEEDVPPVDVVGPVCESSDVLARECHLQHRIGMGDALLIWEAGAYCESMGYMYYMRPLAMEVMIHD